MKMNKYFIAPLPFLILILIFSFLMGTPTSAANTKQRVYDYAGLLTKAEIENLEKLADNYSAKRKTDIIILTKKDKTDVKVYMADFYDNNALGYDKPHGNTAILTVDMNNREVYVAGFKKAEKTLDNHRVDLIREEITPDLSRGNYFAAFQTYIETSYKYMGIMPGISPNNILFNSWFQLFASIVVAGLIVGGMAYNSGGRVTIDGNTYKDTKNSKILQRSDNFIRTTTTKVKKPKNNNNSGGSGGGGITGGGHSHSGSRGSF